MPEPCPLCSGTGLRETPAGTDASGITLLSPQPCSCADPDVRHPSRPFLRAVDGRLSDEEWHTLRRLKAARDAHIIEWEGIGPGSTVQPVVECDEWVTERLAMVIQAALDGRALAAPSWLDGLTPEERERQQFDLSQHLEEDGDE